MQTKNDNDTTTSVTSANAPKRSLRTKLRAGEMGAVAQAGQRCPNCDPGSGTAAKYGSELANRLYG